MSEEVIKFILNLSLPTLLSITVNKLWVERIQKKTIHSEKLVDLSLKQWPTHFGKIYDLGSKYDDEKKSYEPNGVGSLSIVPYCDFLRSHIKSGYPELWTDWKRVLLETNEFNSMEAELNETIRIEVEALLAEMNVPAFYFKSGRYRPDEYIDVIDAVKVVVSELRYRYGRNERTWISFKPKIQRTVFAESRTGYSISFGHISVGDIISYDVAQNFVRRLKSYVDDDLSLVNMYSLLSEQKIKHKRDSGMLFKKIEDIENRVILGDLLKGKCSSCPGLF